MFFGPAYDGVNVTVTFRVRTPATTEAELWAIEMMHWLFCCEPPAVNGAPGSQIPASSRSDSRRANRS